LKRAIEARLQQKLSQRLVITPQLQQAIKILQLPRGELDVLIHDELDENPVLGVEAAEQGSQTEVALLDSTPTAAEESVEEKKAEEEIDWHTYLESYNEALPSLPPSGGEDVDEERPSLVENHPNRPESLEQHLLDQLRFHDLSPQEQQLASLIIGDLNIDGYLQTPLEDIAQEVGSNVNVEQVAQILELIQTCDPPGVGARDLRECLLLQLRIQAGEIGISDDPTFRLAVRIVEDHLAVLEDRRTERLAKDLDAVPEHVEQAIRFIAALEPKPGRNFGENDVSYITPDVQVHKVADEYVVTLNEEGLPRLKVNASYRRFLSQKDGDAKEYVQGKLRAAAWLIKSIHQRQRTLLLVAQSIVKFQEDFLTYGVSHMRPLVLRDVADEVGIHESTVSRAIANKYIATPRGIVALKKFFTTGLRNSQGQDIAADSVKERIRELIQGEDSSRPLSDEEIARTLSRDNISIARRTVAKYREAMNILPSSKRKQARS
jgi:RNA polymerase sigma-54 factor